MHLSCVVVLELFSINHYIWTGSDQIEKTGQKRLLENNSRTTQHYTFLKLKSASIGI